MLHQWERTSAIFNTKQIRQVQHAESIGPGRYKALLFQRVVKYLQLFGYM